MASLPYRYQEILTALRDNPQGLTTKQIFDICRKAGGSELPDATITGQCVFALRKSKIPQITTKSISLDGTIYKITQYGLDRLAEALGDTVKTQNLDTYATATPIEPNPVAQSTPQPAPIEALEPNDPDDEAAAMPDVGPDLLASFDEAALIIRKCILDVLITPESPVKIRDKSRKMAVLERLEPLFSTDIADMLAAIRADLDVLEAE